MNLKKLFASTVAPIVFTMGLAFGEKAQAQTTLAGNGNIGCNSTNGVPATSVPLTGGGLASDKLGLVFWSEPDCQLIKKIDRNGDGNQTIIASGVRATALDIKPFGSSVIFYDANDGKIKEVNKNGGAVTTLASAPQGVRELEQAQSDNLVRYIGNDGKLYLLGGIELQDFGGAQAADIESVGGSSWMVIKSNGAQSAVLCKLTHSTNQLDLLTNLPPAPGEPVHVAVNVNDDKVYVEFTNGQIGKYSLSGAGDLTSTYYGTQNDLEVDFSRDDVLASYMPAVRAYDKPGAVLPVTWLSFGVKQEKDKAVLRWSTASEQDNDRFDVQRSKDSKNWTDIGSVKGQGNATTKSTYEFADNNLEGGTLYYRLKQVDLNNNFSYSDIESLSVQGLDSRLSIYPNPADNVLNLKGDGISSARIHDATGHVVQEFNMQANDNQATLDVSHLPSGFYTVQAQTKQGPQVQKLVIQ